MKCKCRIDGVGVDSYTCQGLISIKCKEPLSRVVNSILVKLNLGGSRRFYIYMG